MLWAFDSVSQTLVPLTSSIAANIGGQSRVTQNISDTDMELQNEFCFTFNGCVKKVCASFATVGTEDFVFSWIKTSISGGSSVIVAQGVVTISPQANVFQYDITSDLVGFNSVLCSDAFRERIGWDDSGVSSVAVGVPVGWSEFSLEASFEVTGFGPAAGV